MLNHLKDVFAQIARTLATWLRKFATCAPPAAQKASDAANDVANDLEDVSRE